MPDTVKECQGVPESDKELEDEWKDQEEDKELEAEMIRLQIKMEKDKEERLERRDRKREEEDRKFLIDVVAIEEREKRLERTRLLTAEARRKEEQEWLKNALLQEDAVETPAASTSSPGDPPPILLSESSLGVEPWWGEGKMIKKSGGEEEMAKSNPAGPTSTSIIPDPEDPSLAEKNEMKKPGTITIPELDIARAEEQCVDKKTVNYFSDSAPATGLVKKLEQKKHSDKTAASAARKRMVLHKSRSIQRRTSMSSMRDLSSTMVDTVLPRAASQVVSKLIAQFETSDSPVKQPGPPHASTSTAVSSKDMSSSFSSSTNPKPEARPVRESQRK